LPLAASKERSKLEVEPFQNATMAWLLLAFLGGVLTIVSPGIPPVLPFVFAKADQPFRKSGLPVLAGMAITFAGLASIATLGGSWVVRANRYGRAAALVVLASGLVTISATGAEAQSNRDAKSTETYAGYGRADYFVSPGGLRHDVSHIYSLPKHLELNQWGISGPWTDQAEVAGLDSAPGRIVFRFHARDLHLVRNGLAGYR
jgi:hypothetical protein